MHVYLSGECIIVSISYTIKREKFTWKEEEERRLGCDDKDNVDTAFGKCGSDP